MQGYDKRPRNDACRLSWLIAKWKSYVYSRKRSFSFMGLGIIGRRAPNGTISANGLSARHCLVSGLTLTETPGVAADFRTFPLSETSACFPHCVERGENRSTGEDVLYGDQPVGMKLREVSRISTRYPRVRNEDGFEANWYHDGKGLPMSGAAAVNELSERRSSDPKRVVFIAPMVGTRPRAVQPSPSSVLSQETERLEDAHEMNRTAYRHAIRSSSTSIGTPERLCEDDARQPVSRAEHEWQIPLLDCGS